ncbi:hypothetical protein C8J57DRAFT_1511366 [Mycena rebaudengoi]|nr:hypothetical protein C8J57DRAFT_1511366 [Mycena rebaudengoi]
MLVPRRAMVTSAFRVRFRFVASAPSTARESTFSIQLRVFHLIPTNQHACAKAGPLHADPAAALDGYNACIFAHRETVRRKGRQMEAGLFPSTGAPSPRTPATSPAPAPDPVALHAALITLTNPPVLNEPMSEPSPALFKGDAAGENATDFLNAIRRRILLSPAWKDDEKIEYFELSLKSGSYAKSWYTKLPAKEKDTFRNLTRAFQAQWPEREMAVKEKGELQEELLNIVLTPAEVGVRFEEDGVEVWGQVRWVVKVAELAARIKDDGGLIPQVLKNIPDSLLLRLGPKRSTWAELVQTIRDIPTTDVASVRRLEDRMATMEAQINTANSTITALQQTPTRGLTAAFSGMAASSPARKDPVRRTLFPAAVANTATPRGPYRPDAERMQMLLASPVTIHPRNAAGMAAYAQQLTTYNQKHGTLKPSEDRPYPLTPGTAPIGSGECHKCGLMGHFSAECTTASNLLVPDVELRWRQSVQSIRTQVGRAERAANINVVADAGDADEDDDVFGTVEYDARVIHEYLRSQGKAGGPSA